MALELMADRLIHPENPIKGLDVGSGSGVLCVCMALLLGNPHSRIIGIDHIPELVDQSIRNVIKDGHESLLQNGSLVLREGDGRLGCPEDAPFDIIHVGAAIIDPQVKQTLVEQLANGGILVLPFGSSYLQSFQIVHKDAQGQISERSVCDVQYIPLTSKRDQLL